MHPTIKEYLDYRKEKKNKDQLKKAKSDEEKAEIIKENDFQFSIEQWLPKAAERAWQITITTHPSRFTHPYAASNSNGKTTQVIANVERSNDGYLKSGNLPTKADSAGNSAALDVYALMHLVIDGQLLITHIEKETPLARDLLKIKTASYDDLRDGFLAMIIPSGATITSTHLKQVYFPVTQEAKQSSQADYHLLSLLSNSGMIYDLKSRMNEMSFSDKTKEIRALRKEGAYSHESFSEVFKQVTIAYCASNPQTISFLNSKNVGKAYLLDSSPPIIKKRNVIFPSRNFFEQSIPYPLKKKYAHLMHAVYKDTRGTSEVRGRYEKIIAETIDEVIIQTMWDVRAAAPSQYYEKSSQLGAHQKTWLTAGHEVCEASEEWLDEVIDEISRWILSSYRQILGEKKAVPLSDMEKKDITKLIAAHREQLR